ncbi:MAG TPA: phage holin family protein [Limnochordales bacterium]
MAPVDWVRAIVRFVVSAVVLMFVGAIVPGFRTVGFGSALLAALVIAGLGWLVEALLGRGISPYSRGLVGFLVSAAVIWAAQFVVPGMSVTLMGALLAALVIGIVDLFVPTALR